MAGPVGHVICAMALLNSGQIDIKSNDTFFAGTSFNDIRYFAHQMHRSATHKTDAKDLNDLKKMADFDAGMAFHIFVDKKREEHMEKNNIYELIPKGPMQTQILKIIEDDLLFERLKNNIDAKKIFNKIYDEELKYNIPKEDIERWHNFLMTYLDQSFWFDALRYYSSLTLFQNPKDIPKGFFDKILFKMKKFSLFVYIYFKIKRLKRNEKIRQIIFDFYDNALEKIFPQKIDEVVMAMGFSRST